MKDPFGETAMKSRGEANGGPAYLSASEFMMALHEGPL